jgi:hypothetical protein
MFGPDPKDATIEALRSENGFLRGQVTQLQDKLLAITDKAAYRMVHPAPPETRPAGSVTRIPVNSAYRRDIPFRPVKDNEDIHKGFEARPESVTTGA